jgi:hypothetical protein
MQEFQPEKEEESDESQMKRKKKNGPQRVL